MYTCTFIRITFNKFTGKVHHFSATCFMHALVEVSSIAWVIVIILKWTWHAYLWTWRKEWFRPHIVYVPFSHFCCCFNLVLERKMKKLPYYIYLYVHALRKKGMAKNGRNYTDIYKFIFCRMFIRQIKLSNGNRTGKFEKKLQKRILICQPGQLRETIFCITIIFSQSFRILVVQLRMMMILVSIQLSLWVVKVSWTK